MATCCPDHPPSAHDDVEIYVVTVEWSDGETLTQEFPGRPKLYYEEEYVRIYSSYNFPLVVVRPNAKITCVEKTEGIDD